MAFAVVIVQLDAHRTQEMRLPASIIPSLSIVVGLMLVFRNQTSYDRFWQGQNHLTTICSAIRNLTRTFLACSHQKGHDNTPDEKADTEMTVRVLLAYLYAVKRHLRAQWGTCLPNLTRSPPVGETPRDMLLAKKNDAEFDDLVGLLPAGMKSFEDQGLGLPFQLSVYIETYIKRGADRGWFHAPLASQLTAQINSAISSFGAMETVRLTPIPVAYLIHMKQVLALFGCVLPLAMVGDMGWWTVIITALITFTLYGIEGIGQQLEDPFGYDKNDIKMDAVVEDLRVEIMVMLDQWRAGGAMYQRLS